MTPEKLENKENPKTHIHGSFWEGEMDSGKQETEAGEL